MKQLAIKSILSTGLLGLAICSCNEAPHNSVNPEVVKESSALITVDHYSFRDLNKNGKLDIYEDIRQPLEARVSDILKQMTLEEKAGMMFINGARVNDDGSIIDKPGKGLFAFAPNGLKLMDEKKMNHFN